MINVATCTREIKYRIAMIKAVLHKKEKKKTMKKKKKIIFTRKLDLNLRKMLLK
jgi:hypothetical protein